ncbi:MAG: Flp pilus assembly complex ATPase component TadA, partial [Deltaproteobacteria bacterium]|nr:Flp pilus assembly complex ATPase component TadA [Deltaproteobacteria bacterium]
MAGLPSVGQYAQDLVKEGLLTKDQLAVAKVSQQNLGEELGQILVTKGYLTEEKLLEFLSRHLNIPYVSLKQVKPDPKLLREIPVTLAKKHLLIPLKKNSDGKIDVAMANPMDAFVLDDLKQAFHGDIHPHLASAQEILEMIEQTYVGPAGEKEKKMIGVLETITEEETFGRLEYKKIEEMASGPKVIAAVNDIITKAWSERASDIHIEPFQDTSRIRYRIDGFLSERGAINKNMHLAVVSRIKIMAGLDIAEHRVPQDGRVRIRMIGRTLDMRISTCPTQYGEKVVLRLLSKESLRSIEDLGLDPKDRRLFSDLVTSSHGIFLATGPTGSGKSTTLYSALMRINSPDINIVSIEDPIENEIEGIAQVAVNVKTGLDFARVLRSVLRQDPDVIMIGEIRDAETANIAIRAAITGHMVLSTLHTNTAAGAISRLLDLGVEPFLLNAALNGVMAQRLVRKICPACKEEFPLNPDKLGDLAQKIKKAYRGKGCPECLLSGYHGRVGIFELVPVTEALREMVYKKASDVALEAEVRKMGIVSLREDGFRKVEKGITTIEEVLRV